MDGIAALPGQLGTTWFELAGFLTGILYVVLIIRQRVLAWPVGLVNAAVYLVVFSRAGLFSDAGLQVVYLGLSAYGWYHWLHGGRGGTALRVARISTREAALVTAASAAIWVVLGTVTSRIPGAAIPWIDAVPVSLSLAAQWMTTRKHLENWAVWIVANLIYVAMFAWRGLTLTAVLYTVFLVLAIRGLVTWRQSLEQTFSASS
jgi:nicotinamide mononucleotide transporter